MQNPYEPPKEYEQERLPKYQEPLIDWAGVIIILGHIICNSSLHSYCYSNSQTNSQSFQQQCYRPQQLSELME